MIHDASLEPITSGPRFYPGWWVWGGGSGRERRAWIKLALPLAALSRSGSRRTSVITGAAGRASSGCLVSLFGFTRRGVRSSVVFLLCARSTLTHGQEASGRTGSAPTLIRGVRQNHAG